MQTEKRCKKRWIQSWTDIIKHPHLFAKTHASVKEETTTSVPLPQTRHRWRCKQWAKLPRTFWTKCLQSELHWLTPRPQMLWLLCCRWSERQAKKGSGARRKHTLLLRRTRSWIFNFNFNFNFQFFNFQFPRVCLKICRATSWNISSVWTMRNRWFATTRY